MEQDVWFGSLAVAWVTVFQPLRTRMVNGRLLLARRLRVFMDQPPKGAIPTPDRAKRSWHTTR